jgi:hypothetical protein
VGRLLLRYSDGTNERREPPTVPDLGAIVRRAGQEWVVASIETDGDNMVAVLRRVPKQPDLTDARVEVA